MKKMKKDDLDAQADQITIPPFGYGAMLNYSRIMLWRPMRALLRWLLFPEEMRGRAERMLRDAQFTFSEIPPEEFDRADGTPDFLRQVAACAPRLAEMQEEIAIFFDRFAKKNYVGFQVHDVARNELFEVTVRRVGFLTPADVAGRMRGALEMLGVAHDASLYEAELDGGTIAAMALAMCNYNDPPANGQIVSAERITAACRGLQGHDYVKVFRFLCVYNAWLRAREEAYDPARITN